MPPNEPMWLQIFNPVSFKQKASTNILEISLIERFNFFSKKTKSLTWISCRRCAMSPWRSHLRPTSTSTGRWCVFRRSTLLIRFLLGCSMITTYHKIQIIQPLHLLFDAAYTIRITFLIRVTSLRCPIYHLYDDYLSNIYQDGK